jgi:hypothetical protein
MTTDFSGLDDAVATVNGQKQQLAAGGVRNSMQFAPAANPDAEAEHRHLAQFLGQPLDTVRADPERARVQASLLATDADRLAAETPVTADTLGDQSNARMLHDAIPNVAATEQAVQALAAQPRRGVWDDIVSGGKSTALKILSAWDRGAVALDRLMPGMPGGMTPEEQAMFSDRSTFLAEQARGAAPQRIPGQIVSGLTYAPFGVAAPLVVGGSEGNAREQELLAQGVDPDAARLAAASEGGLQGLIQMLPLGNVMFGQGAKSLFKSAAAATAKSAVAGGAQSAISDTATTQILEGIHTDPNITAQYEPSWEKTLSSAAFMGALHVGTQAVMHGASGIGKAPLEVAQADQTMELMRKLGELATNGKFRERDPQAFNQFVNDVVDQTGAPDVYVDARKLVEALDQGNVSAAELSAKLPDVADQMREALQSEGTVKISLADYATHIAGGPLDASLLPHLKTDPAGFTYAEAQAFHQEQVDQLTPEAQALAAADTEKADARATELQGVHDTVLDQLNATGRYPADVSKAYAALTRDFYGTMAERTGQTPGELFKAHPLNIAAESVAGERLEQPVYHGSGADFDRFTTAKMGTGEGAQAFGWGMYFAGNKATAKSYRDSLAMKVAHVDGKVPERGTLQWEAANSIASKGYDEALTQARKSAAFKFLTPEGRAKAAELVKAIEALKDSKVEDKQSGALYKVEIPDDEHLLDWDKPLSEQPEKVQNAFDDAMRKVLPPGQIEFVEENHATLTGERAYRLLSEYLAEEHSEDAPGGPKGWGAVVNTVNDRLVNDKAASLALHAAGVDGIKYQDAGSRGRDKGTHNYVVFHDDAVKILDKLYQETGARGTYSPETNTITALQGADLSTYLHELGHHFLETTARLAAEPGAPEGIKVDVAHLLGADSPADWLAKPLDERRDVHENFARGFEAYLMEGKAPTPELQSLFGRFRSWLLQVYKSLSALRVQLSPEVRAVMDRMLATDTEIKQAEAVRSMEALFKAKPEGMTDEAYEAYQGLGHQATEDAVQNLQARSLRDMQWLSNAKSKAMKGLQKQADTERAAIRDEVTAEVDQLPAFAAKEQLDRETDPNRAFKDQQAEWRAARDAQPKAKRADWIKDNPEPTKPRTQVDDWNDLRTAAEEQVRATVKKAAAGDAKGLAKGQALMKAKRSIDNEVERSMIEWEQANPKPKIDKPKADLELVAEQHGFNTADEMLRAIDDAGKKADVIEALTDQRMLERHGDLVDPRSIERAAEAAVHNDARTRFLATELTSLAKATGSPRMLAKAAQEAADAAIAAKRVRDLRPDQYSSAEARAGRAADKAFKAGDIQTAAVQKRAQLLSNTLARAATDAAGETAKSVEYLKKFDKPSIREKIDVDYRDQIDSLLAAHDLRTSVSGKALDKRVSLKDFVEREQAAGREPMVPQDLIDEANQVHYKDMTVESFRGMVDAVRSLDHLGRLKTKILDGRDARDFKAVVDEAVASMGALPQRDPETNRGLSAVDKKWLGIKSTIRSADSSLLKMEQVIDWLDGHNANGVMNRVVFRRIADAGTRENDLRTDIVGKLHELAASQPKGYGKDFDEKLSLPGLIDTKTGKTQILLKRELLSAALNRGNESNWQKLLKGEKGWNEAALLRAFDEHLSKADWDYVQGVWHSINSLWPEIDAMERRLGNTSPEKIAPRAFDTPHGTYEGGYYPAVYDPLRSFDVEQNRQRSTEALFENNYQKATTSKGHTIERSENYARPFLLSLDVIPRHMTQVIHDIAYREAVMDADRFLADPRVREGVEGALGREYYQQFRPWLQALANDKVYDSRGLAFWDKAAHWARTTTTMVGLGYRISTMLIHGATAASNSVGEIGTKWMLSGVRDVLGTPQKMVDSRDFIFERSGEMRHRMGEVDRDIRDQLREMEAKAATGLTGRTAEVINGVKRAAFYGVAMLDFASAMPTWMGAYNRGLHEGLAEQEAVYAADKAVRNAHGGTGTKDLAAIQRGPEFQKLFTMFYSFWNHFYNRQRDLGRAATQIPGKIAEGDYAGARRDFAMVLARSFFYFIAPQLLHAALKPPAPGTQDEEENWAHWAAKEIALGMFSGVPVVRDVANSISTGRDYNPTPAVSIVKSVAATAKDVAGVVNGQGPSDKWVQHAVQTAGYVFGLPTGQASSSAQFLWDVADGKQDPQGLADWWKGLKNGHL